MLCSIAVRTRKGNIPADSYTGVPPLLFTDGQTNKEKHTLFPYACTRLNGLIRLAVVPICSRVGLTTTEESAKWRAELYTNFAHCSDRNNRGLILLPKEKDINQEVLGLNASS